MGKADSIMTTKELAEYIKLNEKTVIKMAQNGSLPGVKIGNQWRFYLSAIDTHLQGDVLAKSDDELDMIIKTGKNIIPISRLFDPSLIELNLSAKQNKEVLYALSNIAVEGGLTSSVEVLFEQLKKKGEIIEHRSRQRRCNTACPQSTGRSIYQTAYCYGPLSSRRRFWGA
ncbi:MAG: helix-turn-helix domain-containing protein [Candidatus Omnitrophota bacterium]